MMKHFKKVLSILCAIALLATSMTLALAEETDAQPAAVPAAEEAAAPAEPAAAPEEAAPAQAEPTAEEAPVANAPAAETAPAENNEPAAAEEPTVIEAPANDTPAQAPAEQEEPKQEEPAQAPAEQEEPKQEKPAQVEPAQEEPAQEEPAQEEPAQEEPAQEEPAQEEPAQEEPAQEEPAQEEPAQEEPAQEEPAQDPSEEGQPDVSSEEDDDLEEIDDWGYVDPEVIEANVPEITDELKGLRSATLNVGSILADTIDFGEELAVTLNASDASTVELKLYVAPGPAVNTKVEGKTVSFTPAHSDVPYLNLYTYELANASGRSFEIVLSSNDTVSFQLAAVEKLADEIIIEEEIPVHVEEIPTEEIPAEENNAEEIPAEENNAEEIPAEEIPAEENNAEEIPTEETPAEGTPVEETPAEDIPADVTPAGETAETPVPSIQASVKTYDALKVGSSISDNLVAGQKAKLQVKCGKNPSVTLILKANPDDLAITMDGDAAQFAPAGDGTYTCELENVAFRKFNIIIGAKQDLSFSLSAVAAANEVVEDEEEEEKVETAAAEEIKETEEETIIVEETEQAVEAVEKTEEAVEAAEETEEKAEAAEETEETTEEAEISEEAIEGEAAEDVEDNTEEETEEVEEIVEESSEETEEGTELVILLNDEQLEKLGFRKVQILNENGTDIYNNISDEGVVIDHLDLGAEIWIKDIEIEGWALVYTIEETEQYVKLAEIDKQSLTDEQMLEMGYIKVYVGIDIGANVYASLDGEDVVDHLDADTEMWVMLINGADRALIFQEDEEAPARYINLVDIIATLKPAGMEELPTRELIIHSTLEQLQVIYVGTRVELDTELINFQEDDIYEVKWQYSADGEEYFDIDDATDLQYRYIINEENAHYYWKVTVELITATETITTAE